MHPAAIVTPSYAYVALGEAGWLRDVTGAAEAPGVMLMLRGMWGRGRVKQRLDLEHILVRTCRHRAELCNGWVPCAMDGSRGVLVVLF